MAAATQSLPVLFDLGGGKKLFRKQLSVMTSDQVETLSYNYSSCPALKPNRATLVIQIAPTARCGLFMECDVTAANAVNKTVPVRIYTEVGGDIAGAVVVIRLEFPSPNTPAAGLAL